MKNTWRFSGNELVYIKEVLGSGLASGTSGNFNNRFGGGFAEKVGAKWAVTFNSGTGTLQAALHAVGVGYGDEVILPALTVISNLYVVLAQNAVPIFADVEEGTFNIDPADIERKITPRTKAIQVVPIYGNPCDYDRILSLAEFFCLDPGTERVVGRAAAGEWGGDGWSGGKPGAGAGCDSGAESGGRFDSAAIVMIEAGTYRLGSPFLLETRDSGTPAKPIRYRAYPGDRPVLSGGRVIKGWRPYRGGILPGRPAGSPEEEVEISGALSRRPGADPRPAAEPARCGIAGRS